MAFAEINDIITVPVRTGFFSDDQAAIVAGAEHDGFSYRGQPLTPGFRTIRQPGEALSVVLLMADGSVAHGDCAAVQYSGAGGRDPVFSAAQAQEDIRRYVAPQLAGRPLGSFRDIARDVDSLTASDGRPLHTAVRYGVTQALLDAAAQSQRVTMAEVVRDEFATGVEIAPVPIFAQTGDDRYAAAEKMILKEVDVLPHGLINNVDSKLGRKGELLEAYLEWLTRRITDLRVDPNYNPRLHIDTYGTVGMAFDGDIARVASYLAGLADLVSPFQLTIEHPIDAGSRDAQITTYVALRAELARMGSSVMISVDEWCNTLDDIRLFVDAGAADMVHVKTPDLGGINNTIDALLLVRESGLAAYCGGTCNETDRSAQISAHLAMACGAAQVLAKPGMGVDEGLLIVGNEMARTTEIVRARARMTQASR